MLKSIKVGDYILRGKKVNRGGHIGELGPVIQLTALSEPGPFTDNNSNSCIATFTGVENGVSHEFRRWAIFDDMDRMGEVSNWQILSCKTPPVVKEVTNPFGWEITIDGDPIRIKLSE